MRKIAFSIILIISFSYVFGQKKQIDYEAIYSWPEIVNVQISPDGQYMIYEMRSERSGSKLTIQSIDDSWKLDIQLSVSVGKEVFSFDNRRLIFAKSADSIGIIDLGTKMILYLSNILSFDVDKNGQILAYRLKDDPSRSIFFYDLSANISERFTMVSDYQISDNGEIAVLQKSGSENSASTDAQILWVDLIARKSIIIAHNCMGRRFTFDAQARQLVFLKKEVSATHPVALMYFNRDMDSAKILVDQSTRGMEGYVLSEDQASFQITNGPRTISLSSPFFSLNVGKLFFNIRKTSELPNVSDTIAKVDIWNYKDKFLRSQQRKPWVVAAVLNFDKPGSIIRLQNEEDEYVIRISDNGNGKYVLLEGDVEGDPRESHFHIASRPNIYLVSTESGSRKSICKRLIQSSSGLQFSPGGNFVAWYDRIKQKWFCYDIISGKLSDLTGLLPHSFANMDFVDHPKNPAPEGIAGWLANDKGVLIYDKYDIWKFDIMGSTEPVNITSGYGRRKKIVFRYMNFKSDTANSIQFTDTLLLSAYSTETKHRGFYSQVLGSSTIPRQLTMGPFCWNLYPAFGNEFVVNNYIYKARDTDAFIIMKMKDTMFPNLFVTRNFKTFRQITSLAPQKQYHWYTNELIHWRAIDGKMEEGILYKPEKFDAKNKYPIIFYYYEQNSDHLNVFISPDLSNGVIDIPWFVSRGYLVCVPDINYRLGHPGQSAYNSVVSCAEYLSKKPWVDGKRMGLQGGSLGGFETNYIITHSKIFAVACSSAGTTNIVGDYGMELDGASASYYYEVGQGRIGAPIWESPKLYIENSPIFMPDKVTTPLLILSNKEDALVLSNTQAFPWFTFLRRLGRKVWMLQYDGEGHKLNGTQSQLDYTIRLTQFFDYYLKNAQPPTWMTVGVPAKLKGISSGLELDFSGRKP